MKKFRVIALLLCMILLLQGIAAPVLADEPEEQTTDAAAETTGATEPSDHFVIPEGIDGDASVSHGCHGIDGKAAICQDPKLTETAKGAFLYEATTGTVLYAKNPDEKLYPASLTKAMTCLIVLENGNPDDMVTVSEAAIANIDPDGSSANLEAGEEMTVRDLLYCLMVESANDAGAVLAEYIAGSEAKFCDMMNEKAQAIGCTGTHFANPHGLHDEQHYTTARDMAKILAYAIENPFFKKISGTSYYQTAETNKSYPRELYTTNLLLGKELMDYYYDDRVVCGKTGFTSAAGRCLMVAAEDKGSDFKLISVILGAQEEVAEDGYTVLRYGSFEETAHMLDHGFDTYTTAEVCKPGQTIAMFEVPDGDNGVVVEPGSAFRAVLPAGFTEDQITVRAEPQAGGLHAPIALGDSVGTVRVWYRDVCLYQTEALSMSNSRKDNRNSIFSGGILTDEEDDRVDAFIRGAGKVFVVLVLLVVVVTVVIAVRNAVITIQRRKRRKNRSKNRRRSS